MDVNYTKNITGSMEGEALKFCDEMRRMADAILWPNDYLRKLFMAQMEETLKEYTEKIIALCRYPVSVAEKEQEMMKLQLESFKVQFLQEDDNP